jgi:hypothetical protein
MRLTEFSDFSMDKEIISNFMVNLHLSGKRSLMLQEKFDEIETLNRENAELIGDSLSNYMILRSLIKNKLLGKNVTIPQTAQDWFLRSNMPSVEEFAKELTEKVSTFLDLLDKAPHAETFSFYKGIDIEL